MVQNEAENQQQHLQQNATREQKIPEKPVNMFDDKLKQIKVGGTGLFNKFSTKIESTGFSPPKTFNFMSSETKSSNQKQSRFFKVPNIPFSAKSTDQTKPKDSSGNKQLFKANSIPETGTRTQSIKRNSIISLTAPEQQNTSVITVTEIKRISISTPHSETISTASSEGVFSSVETSSSPSRSTPVVLQVILL